MAIAAVFIALAAPSVVGFWLTRNEADEQEERILHERAGEVAALLLSETNGAGSSLRLLGEVYAGRGESGPGFVASARSLITGDVTGIGVAGVVDGEVVVRAAEGDVAGVGAALSPEREEVVRRASEAEDLVSGVVTRSPEAVTFVFAYGRDDGLVVYQESVVDPTRAGSSRGSPFGEVEVALYRTASADPQNLVVTTSDHLPLDGEVDRRELPVGAEQWLLVTAARDHLVGSHARALPWIVLAGGLAAAVLASGVVAVLSRRRAYALALADERTAELQLTMRELETARQVADAANRSKSEFLSRMSHELRTPLNAVLGFAQLLELGELDEREQDAVRHILKGGHHLLTLINEVLDIARIDSGDIALSPEAVFVADVIEEAADLMRPLAAARSIHVSVDRDSAGHLYVFADRQRFKQILINLLSNAIKYNRVGGAVTVSCAQATSTRLHITIADTGPGIREDQLRLLFVPFERLDAGRTDVEGTGIGLALSRRLAEAMGGRLDVESTVGKGSTFWVELPLVEGPVERYDRLNGGAAEPHPRRPPSPVRHSVLYVEDNLANMKLVELVVARRQDLTIIPAMQGRLGLELARQHRPELILLDLHLPDVSGDDVLQELRGDPSTARIPVVIVSADATIGQIQRLKNAGASAYLTKPFDVRELLRTIDEFLPNSHDVDT